jgi:FkbM family methyltransferase
MAVIRGELSQYGEDKIVADVFGDYVGTVVDVGAADGVNLSHSRALILAGWSAVLVDPLPDHIAALLKLYTDNPRVRVHQFAIAENEAVGHLFPAIDDSFNSTLVPSWRDYAIRNGERYGDPIQVKCVRLDVLLRHCGIGNVDFLTCDAEQMDEQVMRSNDWRIWRPKLVCAEWSAGPRGSLHDFMRSVGYEYLTHTPGSTFWRAA